MRDLMMMVEGRVYRLDAGYVSPVVVIANPSLAQARTLVASFRAKGRLIYLRGLMARKTVYIWDGWLMTHDDVLADLIPGLSVYSDDLTTFEVANYRNTGLTEVERHPAKLRVLKPGMPNPETTSFVQNLIVAINAPEEP